MLQQFQGWVPTVAGNLSFSAFGDSTFPTPAITANVTDQTTRFIISYQSRHCGDYIAPIFRDFVGKFFFKVSGTFRFLCIAKAESSGPNRQEQIRGRLLIFHDKRVWRKSVEPLIKESQASLERFRDQPMGAELSTYFAHRFQRLMTEVPSDSSIWADFTLERTGVLKITSDLDQKKSVNAPKFPQDRNRRNRLFHAVIEQLYYFLRDIGHRHQHHHPTTDTIIGVHKSEDETEWRLATLFSMYRKIIQYKRKPEKKEFFNSLGVLAYAKTFRQICERDLPEEDFKRFPDYYDQNMEQSIEGIQSKIQNHLARRQVISDAIRNTIIGIAGLIISLAAITSLVDKKPELDPHPMLMFTTKFVINETPFIVPIIAATVYMYFVIREHALPEDRKFFRSIIRITQTQKRRYTILILLILPILPLCFIWLLDIFLRLLSI